MSDQDDETRPTSGPVRLCDPSPQWTTTLERERGRLFSALGDVLLEIHHIGSTAVPGIRAKPIVDVVPVAVSLSRLDACRERIEALGYFWWGEYGIARRRYCTLQDRATGQRSINAHFFEHEDPEIERHLAFRDYLRVHPQTAREYEAIKTRSAALHPENVNEYNDGKSDWIRAIEPLAIEFYRKRG
jgi:GrpB-like predicted nucleotidyltransferase (UPF0157 family)